MRPTECPKWEGCSASMCPLLDRQELEPLGFIPDDDAICTRKDLGGNPLVRRLKELRKRGGHDLVPYKDIMKVRLPRMRPEPAQKA